MSERSDQAGRPGDSHAGGGREPRQTAPIERVWRAWASRPDADAYESLVTQDVLPAMSRFSGYRGATLLKRDANDEQVEFLVITRWESLDSIREFAGDRFDAATIPRAATELLARYEDRALHYERVASVIVDDGPPWRDEDRLR